MAPGKEEYVALYCVGSRDGVIDNTKINVVPLTAEEAEKVGTALNAIDAAQRHGGKSTESENYLASFKGREITVPSEKEFSGERRPLGIDTQPHILPPPEMVKLNNVAKMTMPGTETAKILQEATNNAITLEKKKMTGPKLQAQ
ncbi:MAG: hypothetical protein WCY41_01655 [Candidatus Micrarchaeia archaeon]